MGRRVSTKNTNEFTSNEINILQGFFRKEMYTTHDLEALLGLNERTIRKLRNEGYLGYVQVGRTILFSPLDIINFMSSNHHKPYRSAA